MTIYLVRHGETAGNASRVMQHPDTALNATGLRQADAVAGRLGSGAVTRILSSDMSRAAMTAAAISTRCGVAVEHSALLHERNFGDLRGMSYDDLTDDPFGPAYEPPNGESWATFHARVDAAFSFIVAAARSTPGDTVVVTHGLVCRSIVDRLVRTAPAMPDVEGFSNTGVTVLDVDPPHQVRLLNCIVHLQPDDEGVGAGGGAV